MKIAICPGTFDPVTNGHLDLMKRGLTMFDRVIMAVATNPKKTPLFSLDERLALLQDALQGYEDVEVDAFDGLLVNYAKAKRCGAIIRGLRAISDFEYELQMALMNRRLDMSIETVFMMPSEEYSFLTSTIVKEVAFFGGSVQGLVPKTVEKALEEKTRLGKNTAW